MALYDIFWQNKDLRKILKSKKFKYSEQIMRLRIRTGLEFEEVAKRLDMTSAELIEYEYCNLTISLKQYRQTLQRLHDLVKELSS